VSDAKPNQRPAGAGSFAKTTRTSIRLFTDIHINGMIRHLNCCGVLSDHHQRLASSHLTQVSWSDHLDLEAATSSKHRSQYRSSLVRNV
jgi:hypothetical protein